MADSILMRDLNQSILAHFCPNCRKRIFPTFLRLRDSFMIFEIFNYFQLIGNFQLKTLFKLLRTANAKIYRYFQIIGKII